MTHILIKGIENERAKYLLNQKQLLTHHDFQRLELKFALKSGLFRLSHKDAQNCYYRLTTKGLSCAKRLELITEEKKINIQ